MERKRIRFLYRGLFENGTVFVDCRSGDPEEVVTGRGDIPKRLEDALLEMEVGERKTVDIGKGYGEYDQDAVKTRILRSSIPRGELLEEGTDVMWRSPQNPGSPVPAHVVRADAYSFDLDFNHPLAGKNLVYEVEVVGVSDYNEATAR